MTSPGYIYIGPQAINMMPANAVCTSLHIETHNGTHQYTASFSQGKLLSPVLCEENTDPSGTTIAFAPDSTLFSVTDVDPRSFAQRLHEIVHLFPGLTVEHNGASHHAPNGLLDYGRSRLQNPHKNTGSDIHFAGHVHKISYQVALLGKNKSTTLTKSWVNGSPSPLGGSHVDALLAACRSHKLQPQLALIHTIMHKPQWAGPTKDKLQLPEIEPVLEEEFIARIQEILRHQAQRQ